MLIIFMFTGLIFYAASLTRPFSAEARQNNRAAKARPRPEDKLQVGQEQGRPGRRQAHSPFFGKIEIIRGNLVTSGAF